MPKSAAYSGLYSSRNEASMMLKKCMNGKGGARLLKVNSAMGFGRDWTAVRLNFLIQTAHIVPWRTSEALQRRKERGSWSEFIIFR